MLILNHNHPVLRKKFFHILIDNFILRNLCVLHTIDNLFPIETQSWRIYKPRIDLDMVASTRRTRLRGAHTERQAAAAAAMANTSVSSKDK